MTTTTFQGFIGQSRSRVAGLGALIRARLAVAWRNHVTRRQLAELDDRMLKDLGISRAQAQFEANRPIWR